MSYNYVIFEMFVTYFKHLITYENVTSISKLNTDFCCHNFFYVVFLTCMFNEHS